MQIENGKFYFIKNEFFDYIQDEELCKNKTMGNKRPCYYCFKDNNINNIIWFLPISSKVQKYQEIYNKKQSKYKNVDNIVFGYVEGEKRVFLIQNMFPTTPKYIVEKYIKQNRDVEVNKELKKELERKASKVLKLVEKGYRNLVFPDIIKIREKLIKDENSDKILDQNHNISVIINNV